MDIVNYSPLGEKGMEMEFISRMSAILILALLTACGGGEDAEHLGAASKPRESSCVDAGTVLVDGTCQMPKAAQLSDPSPMAGIPRRAQQPQQTSIPHPYGGVPPEVAVEGFQKQVQWRFRGLFPFHEVTQVAMPFRYRCYHVTSPPRCVGVAVNVGTTGLIEGGVYTLGIFEPRHLLTPTGRLIDWYTPVYPHTGPFALAVNPLWFEPLGGSAISVNVTVNANAVIRMTANGYPHATIQVVGPNGFVSPTIFEFRDDHEALALRFTASTATAYTATFVLQNTAGQQASVVVPFTTPAH